MTLAWYGHLKFKFLEGKSLFVIILVSWGIAFFEYCLLIPANRGGYLSGKKEIIALLRQRSRPYLFSNSLAPAIVASSLAALDLISTSTALRDRLEENTKFFRAGLTAAGLTLKPGAHPIVPVMLGDAALSQRFAARMLEKGVYVVGFFYPVVPQGAARIRTQVSAAHSRADLESAINAFATTKTELGL